jgi:hypothetical protein
MYDFPVLIYDILNMKDARAQGKEIEINSI